MELVIMIKFGFIMGFPIVLLAASETIADPVGSWSQLSAVAMMGFVLFWLVAKTLPTMTKDNKESTKELADRIDGWEHQRHEDSVALNSTMQDMRSNCTATRKAMESR